MKRKKEGSSVKDILKRIKGKMKAGKLVSAGQHLLSKDVFEITRERELEIQ